MITTPSEYLDSIEGAGREWLADFFDYMAKNHADIKPVMFRQRPMFKVGKSYLMFTAAKEYFTLHCLNFDLIESLKKKVPNAGNGKGCVNIKYKYEDAKPTLKAFCDEVIRINTSPDAPEPDVTPELPYEQHISKCFSLSKAKWQPLYEKLRDNARVCLPEFIEYFPAVGILWKHTSTFMQVKCTKSALQIEFYSDELHTDRNPVKYLQMSPKRVMHMIEVTDLSNLDKIMVWIKESYDLTAKK